jgi:hypothetical protein
MSDYKERILPGTLLTASVSSSYTSIGTLTQPARLVKFQNLGTQDVTISWDGSTDHDYIPGGGFALYDFTSNAVANAQLSVANKTQFWGKTASSTSTVKISYFYAG